jgi:cell wall-associated NlpC family hydrolase
MAGLESFLGAPYVWGGSTRRGTDCSGLVQTVFAEQGVRLGRRVRDQFATGAKVDRARLAKGDLVFFRTLADRVSHVGVVCDPALGEFIHASSSRGVVRSRLDSRYYRERYAGARRVVEIP